jgi:hypothetical protein
MERETGFEPATSTLARSHSTTELLPLRAKDALYRDENAGSNAASDHRDIGSSDDLIKPEAITMQLVISNFSDGQMSR